MVAVAISEAVVYECLSKVPDPEIPVLTIMDLGIVRDVQVDDGVLVRLSPTYIGCPATEVIEQSVIAALKAYGIENPRIERVLSPPWTTDWLSEAGRSKLRQYGIAPPVNSSGKHSLLSGDRPIACPRCASTDTLRVSEFGSTPCKASYKCGDCLEPFEYFKCI